jgi:hypothetical protein
MSGSTVSSRACCAERAIVRRDALAGLCAALMWCKWERYRKQSKSFSFNEHSAVWAVLRAYRRNIIALYNDSSFVSMTRIGDAD